MAQDDILIRYKVDTTDLDKASVAVADVTAETKQLQTQIKATFSDKSIEQATKDLYEQGDVMGALINKYGNATSALKAMEKELVTMSALGQRNTAQFKELANATAELKDNIGDTRGEIKKMASDTRVFDTMVQGARGITAAFSVATGVTAVFGKESEDLQKAILKVQGAMAALQGVQELANIATEKGGIATKAYGVALQVVDKISKVTGLSMAASWALATGGITLVVAGIVSLIAYMNEAEDTVNEFAEAEKRRAEEYAKQQENRKTGINTILEVEKKALQEFDRNQENARKEAILKNQDSNLVELGLLKDKLSQSETLLVATKKRELEGYDADIIAYRKYLEDRILETKVAYKKISDVLATPEVSKIDELPIMKPNVLTIEPQSIEVDTTKVPDVKVPIKLQPLLDREETLQKAQEIVSVIQDTIGAISGLTASIFANQTQQLDNELKEQDYLLSKQRDAELLSVGDNQEKRRAIEERYAKRKAEIEKKNAIESAKIQRQQAIANKAFSIFNIIASTAQAIMKAMETYNYAGAAIAGALGAVQIATVAAAPLPQIPKFEKGGKVLAGGKKNDGHLFGRSHRDGGILIEAQGGEYIWDIPTVQKHGDIIKAAHENRLEDLILHKYVAPALSNAPQNSSDSYDDVLLRKTIRDTSKESAKMIVRGVSESVKDSLYFQTRYR